MRGAFKMVRAKFKCISMNSNGDLIGVSMSPCKDGIFGNNTPGGQVYLCLVPETANKFAVGKEYDIDFNEVTNNQTSNQSCCGKQPGN